MNSPREKRNFLRHLVNLPILIHDGKKTPDPSVSLDLSEGGLSLLWKKKFQKDAKITISIHVKDKNYQLETQVTHSEKDPQTGFYKTGLSFKDAPEAFKTQLSDELAVIVEYRTKDLYENRAIKNIKNKADYRP